MAVPDTHPDHPVTRPAAQVHFGVFFQGVNHTTIWSDPESGSQTDFATFERVIRTAERGLFDAFFLGEGLRLRETRGALHDLDVVGRPDAITQLAALAAIDELVAARPREEGGWDFAVVRAGRLASAGVAPRRVPPMPVVEAITAAAETVRPTPGIARVSPTRSASGASAKRRCASRG